MNIRRFKYVCLILLPSLLSGCILPFGPGDDSTSQPTSAPTSAPTSEPTTVPTSEPTSEPTTEPTSAPTSESTSTSTSESTSVPTSSTSGPVDPEHYYDSITDDMSGEALKNALYNLIHPKKAKTTYDDLWNVYILYSDVAHPERSVKDGYRASKDLVPFYNGEIVEKKSGNYNKEHVWPNSRGGNLIEGDPHMVRPTLVEDNSSRGNSFYVEGKNTEHNGWDPKTAGMTESYRGDCARIIFYCAVQEKNYLTLIDKETDNTSNNTMGKLSDLLKWNLNYAVHEREINRNNILSGVISSYDHWFDLNRNPFIDHPEYACRIWGLTNSTTRSICGM